LQICYNGVDLVPFSHQAMKDSLWRECKVPHFDFTPSKKRNDYFGATAKEKGLKDQKPTAGTVRRLPNIPLCPVPEGCLGLCGSRRDADPRQEYDALDCDGGALRFSITSTCSYQPNQVKPTVALSANGPPKCRVMMMCTVKVPRSHEAFRHFYAAASNLLTTLSMTNMASKGPVSNCARPRRRRVLIVHV